MTTAHTHPELGGSADIEAAARWVWIAGIPDPEKAAEVLYREWYLGIPSEGDDVPSAAAAPPYLPGLPARLSQAHPARRRWSDGWTVTEALPGGWVTAARPGADPRLIPPGSWFADGQALAAPASAGDNVAVRHGVVDSDACGYWATQAELRGPRGPLLRLYVDAAHDVAEEVVATVVDALDGAGADYSMKAPQHPAGYDRPDSVVAYVARASIPRAAPAIARLACLTPLLRGRRPRCTAEIAPGLAWAEDPGDGASFGMSRCAAVLEGLRRVGPDTDPAHIAWTLHQALRERGIDPHAPHLSPGNGSGRAFLLRAADIPRRRRPRPWLPMPLGASPRQLQHHPQLATQAVTIARALAEEAIADTTGPRWTGRQIVDIDASGAAVLDTVDLGDDLYAGRAGIALCIAGSSTLNGAGDMRACAVETARAAVGAAAPRSDNLGLFSGCLGIAVAAHMVACLVGDADLAGDACLLANQVAERAPTLSTSHPDLLDGAAGVIVGLLAMPRTPLRQEAAWSLARRLAQEAERHPWGWTWRSVGQPGLCGFSHGAAGIAVALTAAASTTGDVGLIHAATEAVRGENTWFDSAGGWPDLREGCGGYPTAWCHGAAGIGIARLATLRLVDGLDGRPLRHAAELACMCRADASAAVALTRRTLAEGAWRHGDLTLCHGAAGMVELLLAAAQVTGDPAHAAAAQRVGEHVVSAAEQRFVSGLPDGSDTPGLMCGRAGVGALALRLAGVPLGSPAAFGLL